MLSFTSRLSNISDALVVFITDKYEYVSKNESFSKDVFLQINSFIKTLEAKKNTEEINSIDITEKKKIGTAVKRNRIKRKLRGIVQKLLKIVEYQVL